MSPIQAHRALPAEVAAAVSEAMCHDQAVLRCGPFTGKDGPDEGCHACFVPFIGRPAPAPEGRNQQLCPVTEAKI